MDKRILLTTAIVLTAVVVAAILLVNSGRQLAGYSCHEITDKVTLSEKTILINGTQCGFTHSPETNSKLFYSENENLGDSGTVTKLVLDSACSSLELAVVPYAEPEIISKVSDPHGIYTIEDDRIFWCIGRR